MKGVLNIILDILECKMSRVDAKGFLLNRGATNETGMLNPDYLDHLPFEVVVELEEELKYENNR